MSLLQRVTLRPLVLIAVVILSVVMLSVVARFEKVRRKHELTACWRAES